MSEKFSSADRLTDQISSVLRIKSHLSAREIAAELGITRKEVNSRLYTHLDLIFAKEGTDPPRWQLVENHRSDAEEPQVRRPPAAVMRSTGLEAMRHRSDAELSHLTTKLLGSEDVRFCANGITVEVSLAEMTLSDPYFEFEMSDASTMQVVINTTSMPSSLLSDKEYLFGHLVHCVADAFVFRSVEQASSAMDRGELYRFKNRVLIQLGFYPQVT
jgi:hypothetical protein